MDTQRGESTQGLGSSEFTEYLKTEYSNIAQAHFTTIDTISAFFRYYLLIMSIPISLIAVLLAVIPREDGLLTAILPFAPVLIAIFFAIAVAGFFVLLYVTNLRMDVILYARTVNAIRKHFYDGAQIDIDTKLRSRVLPQTPSRPRYAEWRYFGPVVACFAILNTSYFTLAFFAIQLERVGTFEMVAWWAWLIIAGFFGLHLLSYSRYAIHREHAYLRSNILGVDIDGVLNEHRTQFCRLLKKNVRIDIDPAQITVIPVWEDLALDISRDDATRVFNDPKYWIDMPSVDGAAYNLNRLQKAFNLKIHLFTHRPWPEIVHTDQEARNDIVRTWRENAFQFLKEVEGRSLLLGIGNVKTLALSKIGLRPVKTGVWPVDMITKLWLRKHQLSYDELTVEKASDVISDPQANVKNRFYICRKKNIKFFVEDDLEKAVKLAYICDVVFLFDQPYNQDGRKLPSNIVHVKSWDEIYKEIRRLS